MSLMVGLKAPDFSGTALIGGNAADLTPDNAFKKIEISDFKGKWVTLFFYPLDFTFVCPTELEEFGKEFNKFKDLNCELIACSTDSKHSHLAWRKSHATLNNLPYPMLADFNGRISRNYRILNKKTGYALRGLYIIDPDGILQYSVVHPEDVGRSASEALRVLSALQTGEKTPCNWQPGQSTLG